MSENLTSSNITVSAKGSLISSSSTLDPAQVLVGSNSNVLIANSAQSNGFSWNAAITPALITFSSSAQVYGSTTAGAATYSTKLSFYTTIGSLLIFYAQLEYTAFTGTGDLRIALPFQVGASQTTPAIGYGNFDATYSGSGRSVCFIAQTGDDFATFQTFGSGVSLTTQQCSSAAHIRITLVYSTT